ncbi:MAG: DUF2786 domain-containing protein [Candidatus Handelsmanbacteria bacterium]|nr:DUF2786 domain-containing protein [Candidatus Handelsmanbacteria bacterium]
MKEELEAGLRRSWLRVLGQWWTHYNEEYLGGALKAPQFRLGEGEGQLGLWEAHLRRLSISARHLGEQPWLEVMETLRHEMAHQYAHEVLRATGDPPHGPAFARACQLLRCSPRATAQQDGEGGEDERVLRVLKKVLSLASSPNEHEAQAAVNKARRLLLEYNLDIVQLDQERGFSCRSLGQVKARHASHEMWLPMILQEFFFVEVLWAPTYQPLLDRQGTVLQIYGSPANLDMAEYVYAFLSGLLAQLWAAYKEKQGLRGDRQRQSYYVGVLQGVYGALGEQEERLRAGQALVWKGDPRLQEYYRYLNPRVRLRRGGRVAATPAYRDGMEEGRRVRIHRPLHQRREGAGGLLAAP